MAAAPLSILFPDAGATAHAAQSLGALLRAGDVVLLSGVVGAGKTHFARTLIQSLQAVPEDVPSPTFTLIQTYETRDAEIWHADLYRLTSTQEIEELGLTEAFETAICLVEWPDRLGSLRPAQALSLTLVDGPEPGSRSMTVSWSDPDWDQRLSGWPG